MTTRRNDILCFRLFFIFLFSKLPNQFRFYNYDVLLGEIAVYSYICFYATRCNDDIV